MCLRCEQNKANSQDVGYQDVRNGDWGNKQKMGTIITQEELLWASWAR